MNIGKDLVAASAAPLVLAILVEGDNYGYAIIKRVSELSGGRLRWTDGMLYPVLHRLERLGHLEARWATAENGRRRRYYSITQAGRAHLETQRRQWQAVDATLRQVWMVFFRAPDAGPAPRQRARKRARSWPIRHPARAASSKSVNAALRQWGRQRQRGRQWEIRPAC